MSFNCSDSTYADCLIPDSVNARLVSSEAGSESEFELFPDLADLVSSTSLSSCHQEGSQSSRNKKGPVIKIKMETEEDEQLLMEYLLGKSNNNINPTLELVTEKSSSPPRTSGNRTVPSVSEAKTPNEITYPGRGNNSASKANSQDVQCGEFLNKNAFNARMNRLKKKKYMEELETSVKTLTSENTELKSQKETLSAKVEALETELKYLKGVLANQSELASLLSNIGNTPGVRFHSTLGSESTESHKEPQRERKRKLDEHGSCGGDFCVTRSMKAAKSSDAGRDIVVESSLTNHCEKPETSSKIALPSKSEAAGVCLHVSNGSVTLEFCARCSNIAKDAKKEDVCGAGRQK